MIPEVRLVAAVFLMCAPVHAEDKTTKIPQSLEGKTLAELGFITSFRVVKKDGSEGKEKTVHKTTASLKSLIFERKIAHSHAQPLLAGLGPAVEIVFEDGTKVKADPYFAWISIPGKARFNCTLLSPISFKTRRRDANGEFRGIYKGERTKAEEEQR